MVNGQKYELESDSYITGNIKGIIDSCQKKKIIYTLGPTCKW